MNYRPKHFVLQELVDPAIFKERGERAWELLQPAALMMLDALRERFGPIIVNNWHTDGTSWLPDPTNIFHESGLRTSATGTGAKFSMHKFGCAYDPKFKNVTAREVFNEILVRPESFPLITALENVEQTVTWLHFDTRNHNRDGIWIVNPV